MAVSEILLERYKIDGLLTKQLLPILHKILIKL